MRSKHRKKDSESSFLGIPTFYMSYEKKSLPQCPTCERRYGIYGVIDSFVPYLKCMCNWSGETWWTPGYGWSDDIRGFKRWKGCVSRCPFNLQYPPPYQGFQSNAPQWTGFAQKLN